jgi:hypothetical protein
MRSTCIVVAGLLLAAAASAQQSPSYQITESTFNAGGHPDGGIVLTSASFQMSPDAIGQSVAAGTVTSASFAMGGGFVASFPPATDVSGLHFTNAVTLAWDADGSVGDYCLYRGTVSNPFDPNYGSCVPPAISGETTTDSTTPSNPGDVLFYLVTARNRLKEEGTKGAGRANPNPCP